MPVALPRTLSPSALTEASALTTKSLSGPHLAAYTLAVYASRSRSPVYFLTTSQDSLPAWRSSSSPVGFSPRVAVRSFGFATWASSSARLVLAHSEIDCTAGWIRRRPVVERAPTPIAIRRLTDERGAQTRVASARVRGLPKARAIQPRRPARAATSHR